MTVRPDFAKDYPEWDEVDVWLHRQIFEGERPEPILTLSEYADKERILPATASAEPGQWRTARVPYMREVMDTLSPSSPVQEEVFMASAQVSKTEAIINVICFIIDNAPGPAILVQPTELMVKRNSRQRIQPTIDAMPRLAEKVGRAKTRDSGNSVLEKHFPGGMLSMVGANSPASLRSMPARYVLLDEVDAYKHDLADEGHPCELAKARAVTYFRRGVGKMFECSTPLIRGHSRIEARFNLSDRRFYHVPCPHCGAMQGLGFSGREGDQRPDRCALLTWDDVDVVDETTGEITGVRADPTTVHFVCIDCGERITEEHKEAMLAAGEWIAENPGRKVRGYHIWAAYSPWVTWEGLVEAWLAAQGNVESLKTFVNTMLGQTWEERGEAPAVSVLADMREDYSLEIAVPERVLVMTGGIDVQKNRIEYQIVGWGRQLKERWILDHGSVVGSPLEESTWDALDELLVRGYQHELGGTIGVRRWGIDTGAFTQDVYGYVYHHHRSNLRFVTPLKGSDTIDMLVNSGNNVDVDVKRKGIVRNALRLWTVGVSKWKQNLYDRLGAQAAAPKEERFCHFPPSFSAHEFNSLLSESLKRERNKKTGAVKLIWAKHYERNEVLDCHIYASAVAIIDGMNTWGARDWDALEKQVRFDPNPERPQPPKPWTPPAKRQQPGVTGRAGTGY